MILLMFGCLSNLLTPEDKLARIEANRKYPPIVEELSFVLEQLKALDVAAIELSVDVTLARGLNYYTGCIFEVAPPGTAEMIIKPTAISGGIFG